MSPSERTECVTFRTYRVYHLQNVQSVSPSERTECVTFRTYRVCHLQNVQSVSPSERTECVTFRTYRVCHLQNVQSVSPVQPPLPLQVSYSNQTICEGAEPENFFWVAMGGRGPHDTVGEKGGVMCAVCFFANMSSVLRLKV